MYSTRFSYTAKLLSFSYTFKRSGIRSSPSSGTCVIISLWRDRCSTDALDTLRTRSMGVTLPSVLMN